MPTSESPRPIAIETTYKGYRFRSRLEAKWAVFFDTLRVPWEYETESYLLPSGPYLPDFIVGSMRVFFEVRPSGWTGSTELQAELSIATGRPCFVLCGLPGVCDGTRHDPLRKTCDCHVIACSETLWDDAYEDHCGMIQISDAVFAAGRHSDGTLWVVTDPAADPSYRWCVHMTPEYTTHERDPLPFLQELREAAVAARSARFEHGEHPGGPR